MRIFLWTALLYFAFNKIIWAQNLVQNGAFNGITGIGTQAIIPSWSNCENEADLLPVIGCRNFEAPDGSSYLGLFHRTIGVSLDFYDRIQTNLTTSLQNTNVYSLELYCTEYYNPCVTDTPYTNKSALICKLGYACSVAQTLILTDSLPINTWKRIQIAFKPSGPYTSLSLHGKGIGVSKYTLMDQISLIALPDLTIQGQALTNLQKTNTYTVNDESDVRYVWGISDTTFITLAGTYFKHSWSNTGLKTITVTSWSISQNMPLQQALFDVSVIGIAASEVTILGVTEPCADSVYSYELLKSPIDSIFLDAISSPLYTFTGSELQVRWLNTGLGFINFKTSNGTLSGITQIPIQIKNCIASQNIQTCLGLNCILIRTCTGVQCVNCFGEICSTSLPGTCMGANCDTITAPNPCAISNPPCTCPGLSCNILAPQEDSIKSTEIKIYTLITPNNDGKNDYWIVDNLPESILMRCTIFDSWGNVVFKQAPFRNYWDGRYTDGTPLAAGNYYYLLESDNPRLQKTGSLVLVR